MSNVDAGSCGLAIVEKLPFGNFRIIPLGEEYWDHQEGIYLRLSDGKLMCLRARRIRKILCGVTGLPAYYTSYKVSEGNTRDYVTAGLGRDAQEWVFLGAFAGHAEVAKVYAAMQTLMDKVRLIGCVKNKDEDV